MGIILTNHQQHRIKATVAMTKQKEIKQIISLEGSDVVEHVRMRLKRQRIGQSQMALQINLVDLKWKLVWLPLISGAELKKMVVMVLQNQLGHADYSVAQFYKVLEKGQQGLIAISYYFKQPLAENLNWLKEQRLVVKRIVFEHQGLLIALKQGLLLSEQKVRLADNYSVIYWRRERIDVLFCHQDQVFFGQGFEQNISPELLMIEYHKLESSLVRQYGLPTMKQCYVIFEGQVEGEPVDIYGALYSAIGYEVVRIEGKEMDDHGNHYDYAAMGNAVFFSEVSQLINGEQYATKKLLQYLGINATVSSGLIAALLLVGALMASQGWVNSLEKQVALMNPQGTEIMEGIQSTDEDALDVHYGSSLAWLYEQLPQSMTIQQAQSTTQGLVIYGYAAQIGDLTQYCMDIKPFGQFKDIIVSQCQLINGADDGNSSIQFQIDLILNGVINEGVNADED